MDLKDLVITIGGILGSAKIILEFYDRIKEHRQTKAQKGDKEA
ncbi:hypothetical protein [Numidum massiliense]|nr:hypothetical protein [Numidum massiliense]